MNKSNFCRKLPPIDLGFGLLLLGVYCVVEFIFGDSFTPSPDLPPSEKRSGEQVEFFGLIPQKW